MQTSVTIFLDTLHGALSFYSPTHDNFLLLGGFNISRYGKRLKGFGNSFPLGYLIKAPTFSMSTYPYSIDHIITNMTSLFMKSCSVDPGISDQHKLIMPICKPNFAKGKSRILPKVKVKHSFIYVIRILLVVLLRRL